MKLKVFSNSHILYFLCICIYFSEIKAHEDNEILRHLDEFQNCICLRWTDWISLGDVKHLARLRYTYAELISFGKLAAAHQHIDTCTVPVSSDCRILVTNRRNENGDQHLMCPYVIHERGTQSGWAQTRFLCWDHTCPCLEWSKWYNQDGPRDEGDIEILSRTIQREDWPCPSGTGILDVECRTLDGKSMTETNNRLLQCDLEGFLCLNDKQDLNCVCQDYMVRFLCLKRPQKNHRSKKLSKRQHGIAEGDLAYGFGGEVIGKLDAIGGERDAGQSGIVRPVRNLNCFNSPKSCWPSIDVDKEKDPEKMAEPNENPVRKNLEAVEKAIKDFESEANVKLESFVFPMTPLPEKVLGHFEERTSIAKPELDMRDMDNGRAKVHVQKTKRPPMVTASYDSVGEYPPVKQDQPKKHNKNIEIFKTEDGRELIIEAVASKPYKPRERVAAPDTSTWTRPRLRQDFAVIRHRPQAFYSRLYDRPMHRRPMPYFQRSGISEHEYQPRERYRWRRPHLQDRRRPQRINNPQNYAVGYRGVHHDPRAGQMTRYGISESRLEHRSGRHWSKPTGLDIRNRQRRRQ